MYDSDDNCSERGSLNKQITEAVKKETKIKLKLNVKKVEEEVEDIGIRKNLILLIIFWEISK